MRFGRVSEFTAQRSIAQRYGQAKKQHCMKFRVLLLIVSFFGLISCNTSDSVFTDETYQDTIKQNIGGELIREIHHSNDFSSFNYDIEYSYKDKHDSICKIGSGSFYGQEPPKEEQLIRLGKWTVFKTSGDRDKDFIFICDKNSNVWSKYEISPETIEQSDLWKSKKNDSQVNNWDSVSKIEKVDHNGNIIVIYTYPKKDRIFTFLTDESQIIYKINTSSGRLEIDNILEL